MIISGLIYVKNGAKYVDVTKTRPMPLGCFNTLLFNFLGLLIE